MDALVWTERERMEFKDVPRKDLKPGWVRLKVVAVGICGSELSGYLGENSLRVPPLIMGHEFSGVVIEKADNIGFELLGKLVTVNPLISCGNCRTCQKGQQQLCRERKIIGVHLSGAFAQFVDVPANQCFSVKDPYYGALVEPLACSLRAVERVSVKAGDIGIVFGAGIIGLMCMKFMRMMGAQKIIAIDTNNARLMLSKDWGATHLINPLKENALEEIRKAFPQGVDCVVDAVGYSKTRQQAIESLRAGGKVAFIGLHENPSTLTGDIIVRNEIEIYGSFSYCNDDFSKAVAFVNEGLLEDLGNSWLDRRSLQDGNDAFQELISGKSGYSKIMLVP
ncbi:galactitol-1-phosphate 5-dehydrogenase [Peribacillus cavernae]|uniref:Galactitol-1-phosphate 5-dehydrogenase n=1 Tax=Peribacillus cavernae TaxID=1674310 RepID=A0A3S0VFU8_9BACI|nr:zinc-binding dehydrogenase [Peribacillus cavernae]MDQ0219421.1 threonine dehydrogenase-like Zn-dependent dehydrogenase [Peribacillus cavernae]RUQ27152.1 galactitol-1-phosphate 5-dehydrogenase [Peribacillus cavernae]